MKKIWCSGCQYNFASDTMHEDHRTGPYDAPQGAKSHMATGRRCLTPDEMQARGWLLRTMPVDVYHDGDKKVDMLPTWITPERLVNMQRLAEQMQRRNKSGGDLA